MTHNNDINKKALDFNRAIASDLNLVLKPVYEHYGFTHFAHTKYFDGNKYFTVCADTKVASGFYRNGSDVQMFFEKFPLSLHSKLAVIWDLQKDNPLLEHLRNHGHYHGITVFYRDEQGIQGWNFATSSSNNEINNLYTQEFAKITESISYIQHSARHIFDNPKEDALATFLDSRALNINETFYSPIKDTYVHAPSNLIKPKKYPFLVSGRKVTLSPAEFDCLELLSKGLTVKAIAHKRGLSPRSIEACVENIKAKFQMNSKVEIVEEFHKSFYGCAR